MPRVPFARAQYTTGNASQYEGYCAITDSHAGDCAAGNSGSWRVVGGLSACMARCASCDRCRFVSYSVHEKDCSWYAHCNTLRLKLKPRTYVTVDVGLPPLPPDPPWRQVAAASIRKGGAQSGYCGFTVDAGDCSWGDYGAFEGIKSEQACKQACRACPRCAVMSWSGRNRDCSWYAACDMDDLRRPPKEAPDYVSVRIRPEPAPPQKFSVASDAISVAILTHLADSGVGKCGLVQWCERAFQFARALESLGWQVSVLVMTLATSAAAAVCPGATRIPLDPRMVRAVRQCQTKRKASRAQGSIWHPAGLEMMHKWAAVGLMDYDFVVVTDPDIDLLPNGEAAKTAARWRSMGPALRHANWPRFIGVADNMAPVCGAVYVVRPSAKLFAEGVRLLRDCRFNVTHGWGHAGPPRTVVGSLERPFRHADGQVIRREHGQDINDNPWHADAFRDNNYRFTAADNDQGFLFYFWMVHAKQGAYFRSRPNKHRALHWRGQPKVWTTAKDAPVDANGVPDLSSVPSWRLGAAYTYFRSSSMLSGSSANSARCVRRLWILRRAIEDDPRFHDLPTGFRAGLVKNVPYLTLW